MRRPIGLQLLGSLGSFLFDIPECFVVEGSNLPNNGIVSVWHIKWEDDRNK